MKKPKTRKTLDTKTYKELEKDLDKIFSEYIRLSAADDNGYIRCPTCGKIDHWRQFDCSHYEHRDRIVVRWDERNVIAQCQSENRFHGGNVPKMRRVLVDRYGEAAIREVEDLADMYGKKRFYDEFWLRIKINEYKEKVKLLKKEKCL